MKISTWDERKSVVEIVVFVLAGLYFFFQVMIGSFVVGMEVTPKIEHLKINSKEGYTISLDLKPGNYGSFKLQKISYIVKDAIDDSVLIESQEFKNIVKFNSDRKNSKKPLRLSPGDKTTFSEFFFLDNKHPIKVDVVIEATRDWSWYTAQWRANAIYIKKL